MVLDLVDLVDKANLDLAAKPDLLAKLALEVNLNKDLMQKTSSSVEE